MAKPTMAQNYSVNWHVVAAGGGVSTNFQYAVSGTIGQPAVGHLTGGPYAIDGGFWAFATVVQTAGAPLLSIRVTATNTIVLSWPSQPEGFILQSTANLAAMNWETVPLTASDDGTTKTLVMIPSFGSQNFRLFKP